MLYGHKEMVDDRVATLVVSATTIAEYNEFISVVVNQDKKTRNFNEVYTSKALQHMVEDLYNGFKKPIYVFYHDDEAQRDAFIAEKKIDIGNRTKSRDLQADMIFEDKKAKENAEKKQRDDAEEAAEAAGQTYTGPHAKTLGEIHGLEEDDPWDKRSEEEKDEDREMADRMRQAKNAGNLTEDFFDAPESKKNHDPDKMTPGQAAAATGESSMKIVSSDGIINADGTLDISKMNIQKTGGPIDENLKKAREEEFEKLKQEKLGGRSGFSAEDFANILAGDRSSDAAMIPGDKEIRKGTKPVERPTLSDAATAAQQKVADTETKAKAQTKAEQDFEAKQERDAGVFRGAALDGEDDTFVDELPAEVQTTLEALGHTSSEVLTKDFPFNSTLGGKAILPFDDYGPCAGPGSKGEPQRSSLVTVINGKIDGTLSMGDTNTAIVSRIDETLPAYAVYQRTGGRLGSTITTSIVKIR